MKSRGFLLLACLAGCRTAPDRSKDGHLEVRWTGTEPGQLSTKAAAGWCAARRVLEISAIQGDTGVALVVYSRESLTPGTYPVLEPIRAESVAPSVGVALRWLGSKTIEGFQGDSGSVRLDRSAAGTVSGTLAARARSVVDTQRLRLRGSFRDLTVQPRSSSCASQGPGNNDAVARDTGVH